MTIGDVVRGARGMLIAQRGARDVDSATATLSVGPVRPVTLPDRAPIESRRTDLQLWRRHWAEPDRLVVDFINVAVVEVDEATGVVTFDRQLDAEAEQHFLLDHIFPLVLARRGELVLHGGVISREGQGVVLVGVSGAGKSTLTAFALQHGWIVGGDDGAVVDATDAPTVEPTYATVRVTPFSAELLGLDTGQLSAIVGKMRLVGGQSASFRQDPVPLALIAFVEPVADSAPAAFTRLSGVQAHMRLLGSTFHADLSVELGLPAIMDKLASLVRTTPVGVLTVPRGVDGLRAAEQALCAELDAGAEPGGRA